MSLLSQTSLALTSVELSNKGDLSKHNLSTHPNTLPQIVTGSMDVKALYPSLDIDHSSQIIDKLTRESEVNFDCDVLDMALHLAATNTQETNQSSWPE